MFNEPVVFVDIETNGASYQRGRIIEVGAIRVEGGEIVDTMHTLINPGTYLPPWITKLTGITENDLAPAPYFDEVAYQLNEILKDAIFAAHNVRFDYSFIKNQLEAMKFKFNPKLFCTVRLSRFLYSEHKGHSLEKLIARHNLQVADRHRAFEDAQAIFDFTKLAYSEHGPERFNEAVARQLKTKTLPPNLDEEVMADVRQKPGVYIFEDESGNPLYVGKSVNIRSRVLSHFASDTKFIKELKISQGTHNLKTIETDTELEALLLESRMIKELMPIHNRMLRRKSSYTVFVKGQNEAGYSTIEVANIDGSQLTDLSNIYGVYTSRMQAKEILHGLMKNQRLCGKLLNLEKSKGACFMYQLGKCDGACAGIEVADDYNSRVEKALAKSKIASWPFKTPIVIEMKSGRSIVVDQWTVVGYVEKLGKKGEKFKYTRLAFDVDTYKILKNFITTKSHQITIRAFDLPTDSQLALGLG